MKIKFIDNIENKEVKKSARIWKKELRVISKPFPKLYLVLGKRLQPLQKSGAKRKNRGGIPGAADSEV